MEFLFFWGKIGNKYIEEIILDSGRCYEENKIGMWWGGVGGLFFRGVMDSVLEEGIFELGFEGVGFEKVWE